MEIFRLRICCISLGCGGLGSPSLMMMMCFCAALEFRRLGPPLPAPLTASSKQSSKLGMSPGAMRLIAAITRLPSPLGESG